MKKLSLILLPLLMAIYVVSCKNQENKNYQGYAKSELGKVYYETEGNGKSTVIFVHGLGCDLNSWKEQRCKVKGAKEIFLDLPGFGNSDKPKAEYTLEAFAKSVICVMDETNTDKAVLVGHSLGTAVCREVALLYPNMKYHELDSCGHFIMMEEAKWFNKELNDFIKKH